MQFIHVNNIQIHTAHRYVIPKQCGQARIAAQLRKSVRGVVFPEHLSRYHNNRLMWARTNTYTDNTYSFYHIILYHVARSWKQKVMDKIFGF